MGSRIKEARGEMTQFALANAIQRDLSTISKWERGETEPGVDAVVAVADATGVSIEWLATGLGAGPVRVAEARATEESP